MRNIRRAQREAAKGSGSRNKKKPLLRPIFDGSLDEPNATKDGTVSGSLLNISHDVPFLCGPIPISKPNLKAWLFRNTSKAEEYEIPYSPMEHCHVLSCREIDENEEVKRWKKTKEAYHVRRKELRTLAFKHKSQQAVVDRDDRLVPFVEGMDQDDHSGHPLPGNAGPGGNIEPLVNEQNRNQPANAPVRNNANRNNGAANRGNNNNNNIPNIPGPIGMFGGLFGPPELNEEDEAARRFMQNQENEAAQAIDAAVRKYRREGVPEHEFEFIKVIPRVDERQNLTARRIAIAIFCVLAAFVCIMIQTIQLFDTTVGPEPIYDQLVPFLLNVRYFGPHLRDCDSLKRDKIIRWKANDGFLGREKKHEYDCGDGVLHIPPVGVLSKLDQEANQLNKTLHHTYTPYKDGINASWFHECSLREETKSDCVLRRKVENMLDQDTCDVSLSPSSCFRGVHDGIINQEEVLHILDLAEWLVSNGNSHITIHNKTEIILDHMPLVMKKLEQLLYTYGVPGVKPVAFQMSANLPVDMMATNYEQQTAETRRLYKTLNESIANEWVAQIHAMNSWSMLSLKRPFRDSCILLSDLQASDRFAYRTSVSLSDGGGKDFSGGGTLFVDNHQSNTDPGKKIQRGLVVDSSRGRVIVSSGGEDNLRCRMPMRSGVRVELHIWWDCI